MLSSLLVSISKPVNFLVHETFPSSVTWFLRFSHSDLQVSSMGSENRNPIVIVYLPTTGMICLNSIFTILALNSEFETRPDYIRYARSLSGGFAPGVTTFTKSLDITYALSFLFTWIDYCNSTL